MQSNTAGLPEGTMKQFSWSNEEVYISKLLELLKDKSNFVIDIGASDGVTGSNSNFLFKCGYDGILIEGKRPELHSLLGNHLDYEGDISFIGTFITPQSISYLLKALGSPERPDFISLDIDSFDFEVSAQILSNVRPAVFCVEINERLPPPIEYFLPADSILSEQRDLTMISSASIVSWASLLRDLEYGMFRLELNNLICFDSTRPEFKHLPLREVEHVYSDFSHREDRDILLPHNNRFFQSILDPRKKSFTELDVYEIKAFYDELLADLFNKGFFKYKPLIQIKRK